MHSLLLRSELLARAGFTHGFSTRWASVTGVEGSFPSDADHLRGFFGALGRDPASAMRVKQVHGAAVLTDPLADWQGEGDAIAFREPHAQVTPVIRTADCVPILLGNPFGGQVAAVHAGWRGVERNIVSEAVRALHVAPEWLVAAIGPCLCTQAPREPSPRGPASASKDGTSERSHRRCCRMHAMRAGTILLLPPRWRERGAPDGRHRAENLIVVMRPIAAP